MSGHEVALHFYFWIPKMFRMCNFRSVVLLPILLGGDNICLVTISKQFSTHYVNFQEISLHYTQRDSRFNSVMPLPFKAFALTERRASAPTANTISLPVQAPARHQVL